MQSSTANAESKKRWEVDDTLQMLAAADGLDRDEYILATYYLETPSTELVKYSLGVALEQTTGTWVKVHGETSDLREKHAGKITQLFKIPGTPQSYLVEIAFPTSNLSPDLELLLATVAGNISWWVSESTGFAMKLLNLNFPKAYLDEFKGPKFGMSGLRDYLGVRGRPILNSMIKPCTGHTTDVHVELFREAAYGGVDHIKDDELLGDIPINPLYDRLSKCMEVADRKYSETGEKTLYSLNITTRSDMILEKAEKAVQAGANGLMLDSSVGFGPLRMLAEDPSIKVPILYHPCSSGPMVAPEKGGLTFPLFAKLARISGADIMVLYTYLGKFVGATKDGNLQVLAQTRCALQGKRTTACLLGGGSHPGLVPLLLESFGPDTIIGAGGAVHGHPNGSRAGAKAMRQAIDAAMNGIPLREHAEKHSELRLALEKWGVPKDADESKKLYALRG